MQATRSRAKRRAILSWIPTAVIALICAGVVLGAFTMQNSWWVQPDARPAADQEAADGMSIFDVSGVHWFTRQGVVKVSLRADSTATAELGLESDGSTRIEPIVPIDAVVLTPDGVLTFDSVSSIDVATAEGRVASVTIGQDGNGAWTSAFARLQTVAESWGWTPEQLDALVADLAAASREGGGTAYSADLPAVDVRGARASARMHVDTAAASTTLSFTIAVPKAGLLLPGRRVW
ncbi:hypothetical protein QL996_00350 [Planococcus sp. APC 4015]|nr:hypothetical protein [Planococcus sp. APC 4015]